MISICTFFYLSPEPALNASVGVSSHSFNEKRMKIVSFEVQENIRSHGILCKRLCSILEATYLPL